MAAIDLAQLSLENSEDRLTNLPESVLTQILSRLPTRNAFCTCILSRAWRMKWTCILNLHFDDRIDPDGNREGFSRFVHNMLRHCGGSRIENFTLTCSWRYNNFRVVEWLSTALRCGVRRFNLTYEDGNLVFPNCFFACQSLEEVAILMPCIMRMPAGVVSFNNLKRLFIATATFRNMSRGDSEEISFFLPALEHFSIVRCTWTNAELVKIEAPVLSTFEMTWCEFERGRNLRATDEFRVIITSGCLTRFHWAGCHNEKFVLSSCELVVEALLDHIIEISHFRRSGNAVARVMRQFSNLVQMEISINVAQAIDRAGLMGSIPIFEQLIFLKVNSRFIGSTRALMAFLGRTPNVRSLDIHSNLAWISDDHEMLGGLPACVVAKLERLYMRYEIRRLNIGFYLIELLLKNARALRSLRLEAPGLPFISRVVVRLNLLIAARASRHVVIEVV